MAKRAFIGREALEELCRCYPTPFHLYDEREIRSRARALNAAFSWNPGFKEYFAVKATPTPAIVRLLAEEGCGCDCATGVELMLAAACGVTGGNIMLSSNDTPDDDYRLAARMGALINLDSADMVECLARALGGALPETVCLRLNPGGSFEVPDNPAGRPAESKFGMTEEQLFESCRRLRDAGVERFGLHSFLLSNAQGNGYYPALARLLFSLAVRVRDELGVAISFVDLSGGVGVAYREEDAEPDIASIGAGVRAAYEDILVPAGLGDVAIFAELGRWMCGPAGALVTRVIHKKETYRTFLGVDACAADLMRPALYDAYHHITVMGKEDEPRTRAYNVVGGLCENNDQFARDRILPETGVGDLLFIHDTGAHGHAMGYNYNGKLRSAELLVGEDGSVRLIRRAEKPGDYFATLDIDEDFTAALTRGNRQWK